MSGYTDWIATWLKTNNPYGRCADATEAMKAAFPELTRVRGYYLDAAWGSREHWWLTAPDGSIVDPTAEQFPTLGKGHYEPWDETQKEPTGQCMDCGEYCYDGNTFCSPACERSTLAYMNVRG